MLPSRGLTQHRRNIGWAWLRSLTAMADEPRQIVARIDAAGLPQVQATRPYATSHFRLALPAISAGASGAYLVRLTLTDPSGNSGTVTATVSKP